MGKQISTQTMLEQFANQLEKDKHKMAIHRGRSTWKMNVKSIFNFTRNQGMVN